MKKTKNLSDKRGSIVKSIDKLASSIASDEANTSATALTSTMMPMIMVMQMQQQQQLNSYSSRCTLNKLSCREMLKCRSEG